MDAPADSDDMQARCSLNWCRAGFTAHRKQSDAFLFVCVCVLFGVVHARPGEYLVIGRLNDASARVATEPLSNAIWALAGLVAPHSPTGAPAMTANAPTCSNIMFPLCSLGSTKLTTTAHKS